MAFFIQLLSYWLALWILSKFLFKNQLKSHAFKARLSFSLSFIIIGAVHLTKPDSLAYMIEDFLPFSFFIVIATGIIEIVLGLLLLVKKWQKKIAWLIIIYLVLIFPANINVAVNDLAAPGGLPSTPFYVWSRLFFQPVYIAWVYFSSIKPLSKSLPSGDKIW